MRQPAISTGSLAVRRPSIPPPTGNASALADKDISGGRQNRSGCSDGATGARDVADAAAAAVGSPQPGPGPMAGPRAPTAAAADPCRHHPGCGTGEGPGEWRPESPPTPPLPPLPQRPWQGAPLERRRASVAAPVGQEWSHSSATRYQTEAAVMPPLEQSRAAFSARRTAARPDMCCHWYPGEEAAAAGGDSGGSWGPGYGGWPEEGQTHPPAGQRWAPAAAAFPAAGGGAGPPGWSHWELPVGALDFRQGAGAGRAERPLSPRAAVLGEQQPVSRTCAPAGPCRRPEILPLGPAELRALCLAVAVAVAVALAVALAVAAALAHTWAGVALLRRQAAAASYQAAAVGTRLSEVELGLWRAQQAAWLAVERCGVVERRQAHLRAWQRPLAAAAAEGLDERGRLALPAGGERSGSGGGGGGAAAAAAAAAAVAAAVAGWLRGLLPSSSDLWRAAGRCLLCLLPRRLDAALLLTAALALGWAAARQAVTVMVLKRQLAARQGEMQSLVGRLEALERRWGGGEPRRRGR